MPRKPRFFLAGVPVHIVQRGNNRQLIFFDTADYRKYLGWLKEGSERYGCTIHAYVLMTNHVHLLATPGDADAVSRMMQYVGRRYFQYINHAYGRSGTLWESRFKSNAIADDLHAVYRTQPGTGKMVEAPDDYPWSSYGSNGLGQKNNFITPMANMKPWAQTKRRVSRVTGRCLTLFLTQIAWLESGQPGRRECH